MFWELFQQSHIRGAQNSARRATAAAKTASRQVDRLEDAIDSLALTCQALWEIVRENTGLKEEDLLTKMEEIDMRDRKGPGKMSLATHTCQSCGKKTSQRTDSCVDCGTENIGSEVFEKE